MKTRFLIPWACVLGAVLSLFHQPARAQTVDPAGTDPLLPVVTIFADPWMTSEPCPTCRVIPGRLTIQRPEPTAQPLVVYLQADGTASPGQDYVGLPMRVEIPAGQTSAQVTVAALDDLEAEGPEVVVVRLVAPPPGTLIGYSISPGAGLAMVVIGDDEPGAPEARLDFILPREGEQFPSNATITLTALGVWMEGEVDQPVEFYDGNILIGQSDPLPVLRPTIPGWPSLHTILWTGPAPGEHILRARTQLSLDRWLESPPLRITVGDGPLQTFLRIGVDDDVASELPPLVNAIDPARFRIFRSGDLSRDLLAFFSVHGSAILAEDYQMPSSPILIRAGETSAPLEVVPLHDELQEGLETILVRLEPSPLMGPLPTYEIDPNHAAAVAVIVDDDVERQPALEIVVPEEGEAFTLPTSIQIVAAAYHPKGAILGADFYAGNAKIGESRLIFDKVPESGLTVHRFSWRTPWPGKQTLTARGFDENQLLVATSPPVEITVNGQLPPTVVRIEATHRIAEEDSLPFDRFPFAGVFQISRVGSTEESLPVFVSYSGTATPGQDYPTLPWLVSIPAGALSTEIRVVPVADNLPEGIETLVATISNCPPDRDPALGIPCSGFDVDPAHANATVFIRDDGLTQASLAITQPRDGAAFKTGETISIAAVAIDLESYISRVEFWDGERQIGVSEIVFIRAPDPGTPIYHSFEWRGAPPGEHALTARAIRFNGERIQSPPVRIRVEGEANQPSHVAIIRPENGARFAPCTPVEIVAEALDPDGYVHRVEFLANDRKIGEVAVEFIQPPPPGQSQTFTFTWRSPAPGGYVLTARATDNLGATASSAPVEIQVTLPEVVPMVTVVARDPFAVEPRPDTAPNPAVFEIRRFGPTNVNLTVHYGLHGTAENGVDYEMLPNQAVLPAGRRSVHVVVQPLPDDLAECIETVVLQLEEPPATDPAATDQLAAYRIGLPGRAVALICDRPWTHRPKGVQCVPVRDGSVLVCFEAETGYHFRVEASGDFRLWETVFDGIAVDGAIHFVDDQMSISPHRFYRLAPEPGVVAAP